MPSPTDEQARLRWEQETDTEAGDNLPGEVIAAVGRALLTLEQERDALKAAGVELHKWAEQAEARLADALRERQEAAVQEREQRDFERDTMRPVVEALRGVLGKFPTNETCEQLEPTDPPADWRGRYCVPIAIRYYDVRDWRAALASLPSQKGPCTGCYSNPCICDQLIGTKELPSSSTPSKDRARVAEPEKAAGFCSCPIEHWQDAPDGPCPVCGWSDRVAAPEASHGA